MPSVGGSAPGLVVERLGAALNAHDLEALLACFHDDYGSEQPAHPGREFRGVDQVRANWSAIFAGVPDFRSDLVRVVAANDTEWSEWRWYGTRADGTPLDMAGVIICGVRDRRIAWARLFVEPVEEPEGIETAVRRMSGSE